MRIARPRSGLPVSSILSFVVICTVIAFLLLLVSAGSNGYDFKVVG